MIEGNKKNIKKVILLNSELIALGELTIFAEPTVTVMESKIPAEAADIKIPNPKKIKR